LILNAAAAYANLSVTWITEPLRFVVIWRPLFSNTFSIGGIAGQDFGNQFIETGSARDR
jgi:hypothetical protein